MQLCLPVVETCSGDSETNDDRAQGDDGEAVRDADLMEGIDRFDQVLTGCVVGSNEIEVGQDCVAANGLEAELLVDEFSWLLLDQIQDLLGRGGPRKIAVPVDVGIDALAPASGDFDSMGGDVHGVQAEALSLR